MTSKEEDQVNGDKLRELREAMGWDWGQVARLSSLSVTQIQALESGGTDCFYSTQIKNNAARKLARVLGVPEEMVLMPVQAPAMQLDEAAVAALVPEQAVVNSKNFYSKPHPSTWVGYLAMALSLAAVLVWFGLRPSASGNRSHPEAVAASSALPPMPPSIDQPVGPEKALAANESAGLVIAATPVAQVNPTLPVVPVSDPTPTKPNGQEWTPASQQEQAQAENACTFEGNVTMLEAAKPTMSAEKISLMFYKPGLLCVQDGTGKVWQENLKPWLGRTYFGKAPWKIHSPVLPQADVYFQGEKMKLESSTSRTIALNGKAFSR